MDLCFTIAGTSARKMHIHQNNTCVNINPRYHSKEKLLSLSHSSIKEARMDSQEAQRICHATNGIINRAMRPLRLIVIAMITPTQTPIKTLNVAQMIHQKLKPSIAVPRRPIINESMQPCVTPVPVGLNTTLAFDVTCSIIPSTNFYQSRIVVSK